MSHRPAHWSRRPKLPSRTAREICLDILRVAGRDGASKSDFVCHYHAGFGNLLAAHRDQAVAELIAEGLVEPMPPPRRRPGERGKLLTRYRLTGQAAPQARHEPTAKGGPS